MAAEAGAIFVRECGLPNPDRWSTYHGNVYLYYKRPPPLDDSGPWARRHDKAHDHAIRVRNGFKFIVYWPDVRSDVNSVSCSACGKHQLSVAETTVCATCLFTRAAPPPGCSPTAP